MWQKLGVWLLRAVIEKVMADKLGGKPAEGGKND
jgi:hypothetical protein